MGCCLDTSLSPDDAIIGRDHASLQFLDQLYSPSQLNSIFNAFSEADIRKSNCVRYDEFFAFYELENSKIHRKIFDLALDGDVSMNFLEYAVTMWNLLSLEQHEIAIFVFLLFDSDSTRRMSSDELITMIRLIHQGSSANKQSLQSIIEKIPLNKRYSLPEFVDWSNSHSSILAPIRALNVRLTQAILGSNFWIEVSRRRKADKKYSSISYLQGLIAEIKRMKNEQIQSSKYGHSKHQIHQRSDNRLVWKTFLKKKSTVYMSDITANQDDVDNEGENDEGFLFDEPHQKPSSKSSLFSDKSKLKTKPSFEDKIEKKNENNNNSIGNDVSNTSIEKKAKNSEKRSKKLSSKNNVNIGDLPEAVHQLELNT